MFRPLPGLTAVSRAHRLLLGVFALSGLISFSWLARIPSVRDALRLTAADLGGILLLGSVGALLTVVSSATLLARFGSARIFGTGAVVMSTGFVLMGTGAGVGARWIFLVGVLLNGIGGALLNVPMNVESARIERAYGRTVIPHFHAAFSAGAVGGSVLGALASAAEVPVLVQFAVVGVGVGTLRLIALAFGLVLPGGAHGGRSEDSGRATAGLRAWSEPRTLLIGVVAFAAALSEGAANNWLSLAFVDAFAAPEAAGGLVLGVFIGSMTLVRVLGTSVIDRLGRVATLQLSGVTAFLGLASFGLAGSPPFAIFGVALWGVGAALCFPIAVAAASDLPEAAAGRVSVVASMSSIAVLTAAPMIGYLASFLGETQHALLAVLVVLVAGLAVSGRVAPPADDTPPVGADALSPARAT